MIVARNMKMMLESKPEVELSNEVAIQDPYGESVRTGREKHHGGPGNRRQLTNNNAHETDLAPEIPNQFFLIVKTAPYEEITQ